MKKFTAYLMAVILLCGLLAACGDSSGPGDSGSPGDSGASGGSASSGDGGSMTNEVTVWAWDTNYNIPIIELAGEYYANAGHENFQVRVTEMAANDVKTKLVASFASNSSEALPDIVLLEDTDAQSFLQNYEGKFAPLEGYIDYSNFAAYKTAAGEYDGHTYVIPFDSGVAGMYYRTDYLEQAGYSAADLTDITWLEFLEIGKAVKEATGNYFVATLPNRSTNYINIAMQSAGLWYFDDSGDIFLKDNPAVREMCELLKELNDSDIAMPVEYYSAEAHGAITSGNAAAYVGAIWYAPTIKSAEDQAGKWAYTNIPTLSTVSGATKYSNLGGSGWYILEGSPNQATAIDMMDTVFGGIDDFYNDILMDRGAVGAYLPAKDVPAYKEVDAFFGTPIYSDFSSWMDKVPDANYGVNTQLAMDSLRAFTQEYFDGKMTLDELLEQAEEQYNMQVG